MCNGLHGSEPWSSQQELPLRQNPLPRPAHCSEGTLGPKHLTDKLTRLRDFYTENKI